MTWLERNGDYVVIGVIGILMGALCAIIADPFTLKSDTAPRPAPVVTTIVPQIDTLPPLDCLKFSNEGSIVATVC